MKLVLVKPLEILTGYSRFFFVLPNECQNNILNEVMTISFSILSNSLHMF
jgi:hypothetical protein